MSEKVDNMTSPLVTSTARAQSPLVMAQQHLSRNSEPHAMQLINKTISDVHITASYEQWQYGLWKNKPACLMVLEFSFIPGFRFRRAEIEVTFGSGSYVAIEAYGPAQLEGSRTTNKLSDKQTFTSSLNGGEGGVTLGVGYNDEHNSSYDKVWHGFVEGDSCVKLDKGVKPENGYKSKNHITWYLREDPMQTLGLPSSFRPAVIVTHESCFKVNCTVRLDNGFFGKHWWKISRNMKLFFHTPLKSSATFNGDDGPPILPETSAIQIQPEASGIRPTSGQDQLAPNVIPLSANVTQQAVNESQLAAADNELATQTPELENNPTDASESAANTSETTARQDQPATSNTEPVARNKPSFDQITLGQWERIWKCRWSTNPTTEQNQNITIYDYLHDAAVIPVSSQAPPAQGPTAASPAATQTPTAQGGVTLPPAGTPPTQVLPAPYYNIPIAGLRRSLV